MGVPLMVIVLLFQLAVRPGAKFTGVPTPVAPVVVKVISGESAVFTQSEGLADAFVTVLINTVIVPVALTAPQPPVKGIV